MVANVGNDHHPHHVTGILSDDSPVGSPGHSRSRLMSLPSISVPLNAPANRKLPTSNRRPSSPVIFAPVDPTTAVPPATVPPSTAPPASTKPHSNLHRQLQSEPHYLEDEKLLKPAPTPAAAASASGASAPGGISRIDRWRRNRIHRDQRTLTARMWRAWAWGMGGAREAARWAAGVGARLARAAAVVDTPEVIVVVYFLLNLFMTLYNKVIMKHLHFNYPWLLTAIHTFFSCIGAGLFLFLFPPQPNPTTPLPTTVSDAKLSLDIPSAPKPIPDPRRYDDEETAAPNTASGDATPTPDPASDAGVGGPDATATTPTTLLSRLGALFTTSPAYLPIPTTTAAAPRRRSVLPLLKDPSVAPSPPPATAVVASLLHHRRDVGAVLLFSLLYTANIAMSNVSLSMVSLPFHQVVRSTNPAVTLALERLLFGKRVTSRSVHASLLLVILGVALATLGEYEFSMPGLLMTLLGVLLSSLKGICTNRLLVGALRFHPLVLLFRMSALAALQCLVVSWWSGETSRFLVFASRLTPGVVRAVVSDAVPPLTLHTLTVALAANGALAFCLNLVSFLANRRVGALSMTVAGNVKQSITIAFSVWVFGYVISGLNGAGILLTLVGGGWYSAIGLRNKKKGAGGA
ncbi:UAA transporter [Phlyctochytrium bullatum]|nr:UAA transporter [Phlyctochytrium bullatum]